MAIVDLTEKCPSRTIPEVLHLATEQNNQTVQVKSALDGVFDLHETINNDLNQTHFTSCNDDFVAGQLEWQYEETHSVEQPLAVQASRLKRTIDEMDRVLKSVFEENDDDEVSSCRALSPVAKAAPLKVPAKNLTSRKNIDLQSVVVDLLSNERAPVVNFFMQQQQQPSKNPHQVVQIHEAGGQALSKKYENNQERFQRDLNKSLQAPLRPFNTESRNLNSFCVASTSDAGRISLEMKGSLQNTSNGVQLKECQLKKMREVFAGGKFPDELMKEFQRHFQSWLFLLKTEKFFLYPTTFFRKIPHFSLKNSITSFRYHLIIYFFALN